MKSDQTLVTERVAVSASASKDHGRPLSVSARQPARITLGGKNWLSCCLKCACPMSPRICVVHVGRNHGRSRARNMTIASALRGELLDLPRESSDVLFHLNLRSGEHASNVLQRTNLNLIIDAVLTVRHLLGKSIYVKQHKVFCVRACVRHRLTSRLFRAFVQRAKHTPDH